MNKPNITPLLPLSFKKTNPLPCEDKSLEKAFNNNTLISDHSPSSSYSDDNFNLESESNLSQEARSSSGIKLLRVNYLTTLTSINPHLEYKAQPNQKHILTSPEEPSTTNPHDNEESNLIVYENQEINDYIINDIIGIGISGQVFLVTKTKDNVNTNNNNNNNNSNSSNTQYAMKIIKSRKEYKNQAFVEMKILNKLNQSSSNETFHIIKVIDSFIYHEHLCIVFELLSENLYEFLKKNLLQGLDLNVVSLMMKQMLLGIAQVHKENYIHCDIKPENILIKKQKNSITNKSELTVKLTDFGSACDNKKTHMFTYIQSRYYRAPEVILGLPFTNTIDIWSLGLVAVELYLGVPLLPGTCEYDQLIKITKIFGDVPKRMLGTNVNSSNSSSSTKYKNIKKYYKYDNMLQEFIIKTNEEYYTEFPNDIHEESSEFKIPFNITSIDDLLFLNRDSKLKKFNDSLNNSMSRKSFSGKRDIQCFIHFIKCMLNIDPRKRWSAHLCLGHPFITGDKFDSSLLSSDNNMELNSDESDYGLMNLSNNYNDKVNNSFNGTCKQYGMNLNGVNVGMNMSFTNTMHNNNQGNASFCYQTHHYMNNNNNNNNNNNMYKTNMNNSFDNNVQNNYNCNLSFSNYNNTINQSFIQIPTTTNLNNSFQAGNSVSKPIFNFNNSFISNTNTNNNNNGGNNVTNTYNQQQTQQQQQQTHQQTHQQYHERRATRQKSLFGNATSGLFNQGFAKQNFNINNNINNSINMNMGGYNMNNYQGSVFGFNNIYGNNNNNNNGLCNNVNNMNNNNMLYEDERYFRRNSKRGKTMQYTINTNIPYQLQQQFINNLNQGNIQYNHNNNDYYYYPYK